MKHYQRIYEDLFQDKPLLRKANIESAIGELPDLVSQFEDFFANTYRQLFYLSMCFLWLEKQLVFNGRRRTRRFRSGNAFDVLYSRFITQMVGRDQATFSRSRWFQVSATVAAELLPEFFLHNPFEEPEYYQWPFHHAGLDFMAYVYQVHNRFELLKFAEEKQMKYHDFKNWANNYVLCYNEEQGKEIYRIGLTREGAPYIQKDGWDSYIHADTLHNLLNHESKKTETNSDDDQRIPT